MHKKQQNNGCKDPRLHDASSSPSRPETLQSPRSIQSEADRYVLRGIRTVDDAFSNPISGQRLDHLLEMLTRALTAEIGPKESLGKSQVMRKVKKYFCIGVNNVTRTLERMPIIKGKQNLETLGSLHHLLVSGDELREAKHLTYARHGYLSKTENIDNGDGSKYAGNVSMHLQAVLVACDVHPRLLVSHIPGLASSRGVPLLGLSGGNGTGSLRLGQCLNMRTSIAVGIKKGASPINAMIKSILDKNL